MLANTILGGSACLSRSPEHTTSVISVVSRHELAPAFHANVELAALAAGLTVAVERRGGIVLHVTSATPLEGVSFVARELAIASANTGMEGVLLLDGNPDGRGLRESIGLQSAPGIAVSGRGESVMEVAQVKTGNVVFHAARLGGDSPQRDGSYGYGVVQGLYSRFRDAFGLTIVDGSSVMESPQFAHQSSLCDAVILVVAAEQARVRVVREARKRLENAGASVLGTILNKRRFHIPEKVYRWL